MLRLTRAQVRAVDRLAIEELGIPGVVLMENAGRAAAAHALTLVQQRGLNPAHARALVVCGGGNNGGDGYVIARHLRHAGVTVGIVALKPISDLDGDALVNARIITHYDIPIADPHDAGPWDNVHLVVDAMLGTGFVSERGLRDPLPALIHRCHEARRRGAAVLAVDLPSGLDCDSGAAADPTVIADMTVTFVAEKVGFAHPAAARHLGRVMVADIGAPPWLLDRVRP